MPDHAIVLGRAAPWVYPLFVLLAMLVGGGWALGRAPWAGIPRPRLALHLLLISVAGILTARVGHVLLEAPGHVTREGRVLHGVLELLQEDPWHFIYLNEGGFVLLPGLIGGALTLYALRRQRADLWAHADLLAPAAMLGLSIGRMACLLVGCCHGQASSLPWAVRFEGGPSLGMGFVQPTQAYASVLALVLFVWFAARWQRVQRTCREAGTVALQAVLAYCAGRIVLELLRGDVERGLYLHGWLSTSQLISTVLALVALFLLWQQGRRRRSTDRLAGSDLLRETS